MKFCAETKSEVPIVDNTKPRLTDTIEVKEVPSQFKSYGDNPSISYNVYTYKEIRDLSNPSLSYSYKVKLMLEGINTNFNTLDLTYFDFNYISFLRKLSTLNSPEFSFKYYCECSPDKTLTKNFKLLDLVNFKDLSIECPVTIDTYSMGTIEFNPLTIGGYLYLIDNNRLNYVLEEQSFKDNIAITAMYTGIANFETNYKRFSELTDPKDIELLEILEELFDHGLNPFEFTCNNKISTKDEKGKENLEFCKSHKTRELIGGELLIFPFRTENYNVKDRIHFGKVRSM